MISAAPHNYTRNIFLQMLSVLVILVLAGIWQKDLLAQIYIHNQVNAVGWLVNGGITILFLCGFFGLVKRFLEYRDQEQAINRFTANIDNNDDPLAGIPQRSMAAERFLILKSLNDKKADINQNALAATLLAAESSRNSFLRFIHNVLILTGVFGTIISLSISLLGASDILQSGGRIESLFGDIGKNHATGLGTMIFGMSAALSTTLTAIIAYLFFGYFYIKLTDTQTFLISRVEEITTTTLMPRIQRNPDALVRDYSDSIRQARELMEKLDQSQKIYSDSAHSLQNAAEKLSDQLIPIIGEARDNQEMFSLIREVVELQQKTAAENAENMGRVVTLLQRGFRLRSEEQEN